MTLDLGTVVAGISITSTVIGGVAWLVRLEGRVTTHEVKDDAIHTAVKESLDTMTAGINRLDQKVDKVYDRLLNGRRE